MFSAHLSHGRLDCQEKKHPLPNDFMGTRIPAGFHASSCLLVWFHGVHFSVVLHVNHAEIMAVNRVPDSSSPSDEIARRPWLHRAWCVGYRMGVKEQLKPNEMMPRSTRNCVLSEETTAQHSVQLNSAAAQLCLDSFTWFLQTQSCTQVVHDGTHQAG